MAIKRTSNNSLSNAPKMSTGFSSAAIPNAPTIGTATKINDVSATVTYTAAVLGATATSFSALSTPGSLTGSGSSPITISGLTPETSYTFTVRATNANGNSAYSSASNEITTDPISTFPVYDSISTYFATSGNISGITFSSIPSTYRHLQIRVNGFSDSFGSLFMRINGDATNANYQSTGIWGQQNLTNAQAAGILRGRPAIITGVGSGQFGTTYPYTFIIDILDYKNTNKAKTVRTFHGVSTNSTHYNDCVGLTGGIWSGTAAIDTLYFYLDGDNTFRANTRIALYGIKE